MIEHPDREKNTRIGLHLWRAITALAAGYCLYAIVVELNKRERWNALLRDYIGGPRMGDVVLAAVIGAAAGYACWRAHKALNET